MIWGTSVLFTRVEACTGERHPPTKRSGWPKPRRMRCSHLMPSRYEPYGIAVTKRFAHEAGCRPVLYLSNDEVDALGIATSELWRVVRFEVSKQGWISWLHEREWRCKGDFELPKVIQAVLVRNTREAEKLTKALVNKPEKFKCKPRSVILMTVLC